MDMEWLITKAQKLVEWPVHNLMIKEELNRIAVVDQHPKTNRLPGRRFQGNLSIISLSLTQL